VGFLQKHYKKENIKMSYLGIVIISIFVAIISRAIFDFKSVYGNMDVSWNDEKQCWDAIMHVDQDINFLKKKKLILKINHK
jgi:hypothetical protein